MKKVLISLSLILSIVTMLLASCGSDKHDASKPIPDEGQPNLENTTSAEQPDSPSTSEKPNDQINHSDLSKVKVFSRGQCEERELGPLLQRPT